MLVSLFLGACASGGARHGISRGYAQSMDSATSACRQNPAYCAAVAGEEAVVPVATRVQAARAGASMAGALKALDDKQREGIEQILMNCVEHANYEVNQRRFGGNPTAVQCAETVGVDAKGKPVTRAMELGTEKHRLALQCIQEQLATERPGGFSLEQRYRFDLQSRRTALIREEDAQRLLRQSRGAELRGSIRPDVVIHSGDPLRPQAIYDLKFQCPGSNVPDWRHYEEGHPFSPHTQGEIYAMALEAWVARVAPIWGIL